MTTATLPTPARAADGTPMIAADDLTSGGRRALATYPSRTLPHRPRRATMTTATLTSAASGDIRSGRRDWYAVSVAPPTTPDPRREFTDLATLLAGPVPADRTVVTAVLTELAAIAGVAHLAPSADDADVVVHRLGARILARYLDQPDHPALRRAVRRLQP